VDALTFKELLDMFQEAGIEPRELKASAFDGPLCYLGRSLPISGGLLRAAGFHTDILENSVLVTEGKDRVLAVLKELTEGKSKAKMFDLLFCEGCINGPKIPNDHGVFAKKEMLTDYINEQNRYTVRRELIETLEEFEHLDLSREFSEAAVVLPQPTEEQIAGTLMLMRKFTPEDQLNCGSCGYPSCREKAIAVCQGLAEVDMCLPYLVEELETTLTKLQQSHQELATTQNRLVQTNAWSWGRSPPAAHDQQPLSTILCTPHAAQAVPDPGPRKQDIQMIVNGPRAVAIMRGLLDFARQSRWSRR
jgi:hypothetical protein